MKEYIESLKSMSAKQLMLMLARKRQAETASIGILGMGCRFPGGINSPSQLWQALQDSCVVTQKYINGPPGIDGKVRWHPETFTNSSCLSSGGFLEAINQFDAKRYGIEEQEAIYIDPQQRLLLSCTWQALEQAGIEPSSLRGKKVGIFIGISTSEFLYASLYRGMSEKELSPYMGTGTALSATSGRIAMALGSEGPTITVDTACSSALTAAHLAVQSLRRRDCDFAVVGAVHLLLSPLTFFVFQKAGMLSPRGKSCPFDADADGYARSEGCGVVILRRAQDAIDEGYPLWGVIRGAAIHQNGQRHNLSSSSGRSQKEVITSVLQQCEWDAHDVQFVEAHGTGSRMGGVIELETLADAYQRNQPNAPLLHVSSVKANLGHMETASGMASLIKTLYALRYGLIPPQVNFSNPDPKIAWDQMSIRVADRLTPWTPCDKRRAGISAFGFTGTNAHITLEAVDTSMQFIEKKHIQQTYESVESFWPIDNFW
jgi:3-oxoacyl-[acyl-carrier-protein] synthase II